MNHMTSQEGIVAAAPAQERLRSGRWVTSVALETPQGRLSVTLAPELEARGATLRPDTRIRVTGHQAQVQAFVALHLVVLSTPPPPPPPAPQVYADIELHPPRPKPPRPANPWPRRWVLLALIILALIWVGMMGFSAKTMAMGLALAILLSVGVGFVGLIALAAILPSILRGRRHAQRQAHYHRPAQSRPTPRKPDATYE